MLKLNNHYIQEVKNLNDLFIIIFTVIDDILSISIRNSSNIKNIKLSDIKIITINIIRELLTG